MNNPNFLTGTINFEKLIPFGFQLIEGNYAYRVELGKTELELQIEITMAGEMTTEVIDSQTLEPYVLHQTLNAQGGFVGEVRSAYEKELEKLVSQCFEEQRYSQKQTQEIIRFIAEKYGDQIEFLWQVTPKNGVFRRNDTQKWYVAILTVQRAKIGLIGEGTIEIIDLRGEPTEISQLVDHQNYFPGYHMNKKHWYTICLDGSVSSEELSERIAKSYALAKK